MGTIHHQIATSDAQSWDFERVPVREYTSGDATAGSTRRVLIGRAEGAEDFIIRYFTIPAGGHSAFESHLHQHGVVISHGRGRVRPGGRGGEGGGGGGFSADPNEPHQCGARGGEPLGFICVI